MLEGPAILEASAAPPWRRVADRFARLRVPGREAFHAALARHFAPLADHPVLPLHFEYAATANERGRAAAARLARILPASRRGPFRRRSRVLDVGCAYGGFLVAFAETGARVTGIEIDGTLLELARINLVESGVDAALVLGDATAAHPGLRGRFDLILANDVVEHVERLESLLSNLRAWLAPSGVAYLEIPNGACAAFVLKDGHHELFGITLLDFPEASAYYNTLHGTRAGYDTYHYLTLEGYRRLFAACGLTLTALPETVASLDVEVVLDQVRQIEGALEASLQGVPETLRGLVRERVTDYVARARAAPRETEEERREFLFDYGASFWLALARPAP